MSAASTKSTDPTCIHNRSLKFNLHIDHMFGHAPPPQWGDFVQCPKSDSFPTLLCEPFTTQIHSQALVGSLDPPPCAAASPQSLSPLVALSDPAISPTNDNVYLCPQGLAALLSSGAAPACSLVEESKKN